MAEVGVDIAGPQVVNAVTRGSAKHLGVAAGDQVSVVIMATAVLIGT